jgi:hypothetical protein
MRVDEIKACAAGHRAWTIEQQVAEIHALAERQRRLSLWGQAGLFLLALALWPVPVINPIKLMVVLFHEVSHVAAAYATGGVVFGIAIDPGGAGATLGMGGWQLAIVAAGYAGSLTVGVLLYLLVAVWEPGEVWAFLCGLCAASLGFGWINNFTAVFGYGTILLMFVGAFWTSDELKKILLRWVATTCCLYPVIDVASELWMKSDGFRIKGQVIVSDVARMAALTGLPGVAIGAAWIAAGLGVAVGMILWSARKDGEGVVRHSLLHRKKGDPVLAAWANDPYNPVRWEIK